MPYKNVKALAFDVFGTVTDWRGTMIREVSAFGKARGIDIDWDSFALDWRARYQPSMHLVRTGELPWKSLDELHYMIAEDLADLYELSGLKKADLEELTRIWHRLDPWPDAREGLSRLRESYTVATLSNGNVALLTNLSKQADLQWDCILSSELAQHYKPDPEVYLTAARLLGLSPDEVMMVAAHNSDLIAARSVGFPTAFVYRTLEYGAGQTTDLEPHASVDIVANDFLDLAEKIA